MAFKKEADHFINTDDKVYVNLVEKDGQYTLQTNVYEVLGNYTTSIIDSDVLGEAFEPEERFENPDGSTIIFDRDYFGNHRSLKAVPGPLQQQKQQPGIYDKKETVLWKRKNI